MSDKKQKAEPSATSSTNSQSKEEFQNIKKTVEAHKAISEEASQEKAKKIKETTEKMIKDEVIEPEQGLVDQSKYKPQDRKRGFRKEVTKEEIIQGWTPKTKLGREVKDGKVTNINDILDNNKKILESEIVDFLLNIKSDLIFIGQAKGKFGGGKRRAWRQTQRKTKEGNIPTFSTMAVVGDEDGHIGIGVGRAKETLPARDKAIRKAKLNIMKVKRTCAGFDCACNESHSIPFKVEGKAGSTRVTLVPAPQGTGLVVGNELKKVLKLAGVKDIYSRTSGKKRTTFNLVKACINALEQTNRK